jgi:hypothetical protein
MAAVAAVLAGTGAGAEHQGSRVVDRTVSCATGFTGGLRLLTLQGQSRSSASSGYVWALTSVQPTGRIATVGQRGLELSPFCRPSRAVVPLATRGLQRSIAGVFDETWKCQVPRSVLLRVRVVFERPAPAFRRGDPWGFPILFIHRPVREGTLVARTTTGRAVAAGKVLRTGKLQFFTSGACFPD